MKRENDARQEIRVHAQARASQSANSAVEFWWSNVYSENETPNQPEHHRSVRELSARRLHQTHTIRLGRGDSSRIDHQNSTALLADWLAREP